MQAAIFNAPGSPLSVVEVNAPVCEGNDLIIRVKRCGICGSDLHLSEVHDRSGAMPPLPPGAIMGHEFAGEIVEIGAGARGAWRVGARVTALPYVGCGVCEKCLAGLGYRCSKVRYSGLGNLAGAYAEYMRIGAAEAVPLSANVDWARGALVEPLAVALRAVQLARLAAGERVLVMGAGPIGLAVAMWCRFFGAHHVMVSDKVPSRLALATTLGATATVDAGRENVIEVFKREAGGRPEVVIECIGVPGAQQLAIDYAPAGGRIVVVGVCMAPDTVLPVKAISKELQINYAYMYRKRDFEIVIDMLERERIHPDAMLTKTVGFNEFPAAFDALKSDKNLCKVMLEPGR